MHAALPSVQKLDLTRINSYDFDMALTYSAYEAKARFSEVLRQVREEGRIVTVSYRGEPVAEIRPLQPRSQTIEERLDELERSGELVRSGEPKRPFELGDPSPGALAQFLADRNR